MDAETAAVVKDLRILASKLEAKVQSNGTSFNLSERDQFARRAVVARRAVAALEAGSEDADDLTAHAFRNDLW